METLFETCECFSRRCFSRLHTITSSFANYGSVRTRNKSSDLFFYSGQFYFIRSINKSYYFISIWSTSIVTSRKVLIKFFIMKYLVNYWSLWLTLWKTESKVRGPIFKFIDIMLLRKLLKDLAKDFCWTWSKSMIILHSFFICERIFRRHIMVVYSSQKNSNKRIKTRQKRSAVRVFNRIWVQMMCFSDKYVNLVTFH